MKKQINDRHRQEIMQNCRINERRIQADSAGMCQSCRFSRYHSKKGKSTEIMKYDVADVQ